MSSERPRGMGTNGARRRGTDGARRWGLDGTGGGVSDGLGLGEDIAVMVRFERAGGPGGQLGRFERIDQVHFGEDRRRGDEIQRLVGRERFSCVQLGQLGSRQVIHDPGAERVAHHVDGGAHPVTEWTHREAGHGDTLPSLHVRTEPVRTRTPSTDTHQTPDSQQPVHSNQQTDVLSGQAHGGQDQQHGHQSSTGDAGGSNTGQGGGHAEERRRFNFLLLSVTI